MKSKTNLLAWALAFVLICLPLATFTSCGDDADDDNQSMNLTLNAGETHDIGNGSDWKSANPLVASVSGSTIKANCVGNTTISSGSSNIKVTVKATHFDFNDPCLQWGASKSRVKSYMSKYNLLKEESTSLVYDGSGKTYMYNYLFENGKLNSSSILVKSYYSSDITTYLKERYYPVLVSEDDVIYMVDAKQETLALVSVYSYGYSVYVMVIYAHYTGEKVYKAPKMNKFKKRNSSEEKAAFNSLKEVLAPNM